MPSRYGLLICALLLVGCKSDPAKIEYRDVKVPVYKYVGVPAKYTAKLDISMPQKTEECGDADTVCELRQVAKLRKLQLNQCNLQLDNIRYIQGTDIDGRGK